MKRSEKSLLAAAILGTISTAALFLLLLIVHAGFLPKTDNQVTFILLTAAAMACSWIAWAQTNARLALIAGILYAVGIFFYSSLLFFNLVPMILSFIGFRQSR